MNIGFELFARVDVMPKIKKICITGDGMMALSEDGQLWSNTGLPKLHFHTSRYPNFPRMKQVDILQQLRRCTQAFDVVDVVSAYDATFMLLGRVWRGGLDLMKIWKKEVYVDLLIYH
jgi:hypothetical protein